VHCSAAAWTRWPNSGHQQLEGPELTPRDYQDAARLGAPFKIVESDAAPPSGLARHAVAEVDDS
jgi:hypothetical protein